MYIMYLGFMMTDIWRFTYCCSRRVRSGKFKSVSVEESRTPEVDLAKKRSQFNFCTNYQRGLNGRIRLAFAIEKGGFAGYGVLTK